MPLPEGFDPASLVKETEDSDFDMGDPEEYEAARARAEKGEPEPDDDDDDDDDSESLTQEELDAKIAEGVKKALEEKDDDEDDEDDLLTPDQKRIKQLEAEKAERDQKDAEAAVDHEVRSAIGKHKMTQEQVANTVRYFQHNPDLEGVVSFEKAALRANPELADRRQPNPRAGSNGDEAGEVAEVITRGSGGPGAPVAFKPVAGRGSYAAVTQAIRSSAAVRTLIRPD